MSGDGAAHIVVLASGRPPPGGGELWREIDGGTGYRRVIDVAPGEQPGAPAGGDADVWVGRQLLPGALLAPAGAGALLAVFQEPVPGFEDEFNRWMDEEHVPALGSVPGVLAARRYRATVGRPGYLGIYHLVDASVCGSAAWRSASDTPWRARMRPNTRHRARHLHVPAGAVAGPPD